MKGGKEARTRETFTQRKHAQIYLRTYTNAYTDTKAGLLAGDTVRWGRFGESMSRQCRPPPIPPPFFRVQLRHLGE